ncbi:IS1595 family transposase [Indioceanicola profundi]|uniref:IS1595 family transposase n=1 Tax=Indioceanicola profundi TaxID=2220096 RepID=UPI000E6AD151|nr:IS1595 family transposase [Indioceanicola profundi]
MPARWNSTNRPPSLQSFKDRFPDDDACAAYLEQRRWPDGFICPECASVCGWKLQTKRWTWECRDCGQQTSVTAGTFMHGTKVPLRTWFLAAHLMATHSNGMSALQLQAKLDLGSYKTAWLLLHKLRRAMIDPDRTMLSGDVEVDETTLPFRTLDDPIGGGQGRSPIGKIAVVGAVELEAGNKPGRIRLKVIPDYRGETLKGFIQDHIEGGSHIWTDDNKSYYGLNGFDHTPRVIGKMAAHIIMPWIHRVFSNLKRWGIGVFHGFRRKYLDAYLNEFVFRWNRRHSYRSAFERLIGIGVAVGPATYDDIRARVA